MRLEWTLAVLLTGTFATQAVPKEKTQDNPTSERFCRHNDARWSNAAEFRGRQCGVFVRAVNHNQKERSVTTASHRTGG